MRLIYVRITPRKSSTGRSQSSCYLVTAGSGWCGAADNRLGDLRDAASCLLETSVGSILNCCVGDLGNSVFGVAESA